MYYEMRWDICCQPDQWPAVVQINPLLPKRHFPHRQPISVKLLTEHLSRTTNELNYYSWYKDFLNHTGFIFAKLFPDPRKAILKCVYGLSRNAWACAGVELCGSKPGNLIQVTGRHLCGRYVVLAIHPRVYLAWSEGRHYVHASLHAFFFNNCLILKSVQHMSTKEALFCSSVVRLTHIL